MSTNQTGFDFWGFWLLNVAAATAAKQNAGERKVAEEPNAGAPPSKKTSPEIADLPPSKIIA